MTDQTMTTYQVWDRSVRLFHWINVVTVLLLIGIGLVIYNGKALGLSADGKLLLKSFHVWIGYAMALNVGWRLVWGFMGGHYARWRTMLPLGRAYFSELGSYLASLRDGRPRQYLGHNPLGRLMVLVLLALLVVQVITGLVLAGTDLYYPPLGSWISAWVATPGVDPATLLPGHLEMVDAAAWEVMRAFRAPYITLHTLVFYVLSGAAVVHIAAVVVAEIKERSGLVSAMIHGRKILHGKPVDLSEQDLPR